MKLQAKSTSGVEKIRQLWKIKYIDDGYYSIRSLYKSDRCIQVTSNTANLLEVSTSDTLSAIPAAARWKITQTSRGGYKIRALSASSDLVITPDGTGYDCNLRQKPFVNSDDYKDASYEWLFCSPNSEIIPEKQEGNNLCWVTCAKMASYKYMKSPINPGSAALYLILKQYKIHLSQRELEGVDQGAEMSPTRAALEYILG